MDTTEMFIEIDEASAEFIKLINLIRIVGIRDSDLNDQFKHVEGLIKRLMDCYGYHTKWEKTFYVLRSEWSIAVGGQIRMTSTELIKSSKDKPLYTEEDLHILFAKYHQVYLEFESKNDYDSEINRVAEIVKDFESRFRCNFSEVAGYNPTNYSLPEFDDNEIYLHYLNLNYSR
jgi:hypothetical protein